MIQLWPKSLGCVKKTEIIKHLLYAKQENEWLRETLGAQTRTEKANLKYVILNPLIVKLK